MTNCNDNPRVHRACGGGVEYMGMVGEVKPYPQFRCTKCGDTWTCGENGGPWAVLIPAAGK